MGVEAEGEKVEVRGESRCRCGAGRCHSLSIGWVRIRSGAAEKEGRRLIQKAIQKKPANQVSEEKERRSEASRGQGKFLKR